MRIGIVSIGLVAALASGLLVAGTGAAQGAPHGSRSDRQAAQKASMIPDGAPVDCIQLSQIKDSDVLDDSTIDFRMRDGRVLRNTLPSSCPRLGFEERFGYETSIGKLCSTDVITVLESGPVRGTTCGLGQFQPVKRAAG